MGRLNFAEHKLTKGESEAPEKARNSESEESEAVHLVSLPESASEGDSDVLAPGSGCNFYDYCGPNATYMTTRVE